MGEYKSAFSLNPADLLMVCAGASDVSADIVMDCFSRNPVDFRLLSAEVGGFAICM